MYEKETRVLRLIHRDYTELGAEVAINIYDDRIDTDFLHFEHRIMEKLLQIKDFLHFGRRILEKRPHFIAFLHLEYRIMEKLLKIKEFSILGA